MRALPLAAALLLVLPVGLATVPAGARVEAYTAPNGGHGYLATPAGAPLGLVVILHGYGHQASDHVGHLQHLADQGWLAVAMDYTGNPEGFPLRAGADDTESAILDIDTRGLVDPAAPRVLFSVSMGTAVASMVLAEETPRFGRLGFDYWVDSEGLSMLAETWTEATALAPANGFAQLASDEIARECGGTPVEQPACYQERSAALRAREFGTSAVPALITGGEPQHLLKGAVLVHGLNDGLVPYNQGREMQAALRAVGVPVEFHTYVRCQPGNEGTTITGYAPTGQGGFGLAGHGTESNDAHCLTALSFRLLDEVLAGRAPLNSEAIVDDGPMALA